MQDFETLFHDIIDQKIGEEETTHILLKLNQAPYPKEAFIGATAALKKRMIHIKAPKGAIDVCGTGGDKLNTLNVSTAVCFVVAGAGVPVAKHGNKAVSSLSGSADIFTELGIKLSNDPHVLEQSLKDNNLCFLFAPFFHQSLKNLANIRKNFAQQYHAPTIFNFLGPLLNPANTTCQLIGTSRKNTMKNMLDVASNAGDPTHRTYIVHGFDGMDEITLCDNSYLLRCENGHYFEEEVINPEKYGLKKVTIDHIKGQDIKYNATKLINLLEGEKSAYRDIVILNAAYAFKVANKVNNIEEGLDLANATIDQGLALKTLNSLYQTKNL